MSFLNLPKNITRQWMRQWIAFVNKKLNRRITGDGKTVRVRETPGGWTISAIQKSTVKGSTAKTSKDILPFEVKLTKDEMEMDVLEVYSGEINMGEINGIWPYPVNGVQPDSEQLGTISVTDGELYIVVKWLAEEVTAAGYTRNFEVDFELIESNGTIPIDAYDQAVYKIAKVTSQIINLETVYSVDSIFNKNLESRWL